jgi:hypothetical protein
MHTVEKAHKLMSPGVKDNWGVVSAAVYIVGFNLQRKNPTLQVMKRTSFL